MNLRTSMSKRGQTRRACRKRDIAQICQTVYSCKISHPDQISDLFNYFDGLSGTKSIDTLIQLLAQVNIKCRVLDMWGGRKLQMKQVPARLFVKKLGQKILDTLTQYTFDCCRAIPRLIRDAFYLFQPHLCQKDRFWSRKYLLMAKLLRNHLLFHTLEFTSYLTSVASELEHIIAILLSQYIVISNTTIFSVRDELLRYIKFEKDYYTGVMTKMSIIPIPNLIFSQYVKEESYFNRLPRDVISIILSNLTPRTIQIKDHCIEDIEQI